MQLIHIWYTFDSIKSVSTFGQGHNWVLIDTYSHIYRCCTLPVSASCLPRIPVHREPVQGRSNYAAWWRRHLHTAHCIHSSLTTMSSCHPLCMNNESKFGKFILTVHGWKLIIVINPLITSQVCVDDRSQRIQIGLKIWTCTSWGQMTPTRQVCRVSRPTIFAEKVTQTDRQTDNGYYYIDNNK